MLYTVCSVVRFFLFCLLAISHVIIPGIEGNKNYPLKMGAIETRKPEEQLLASYGSFPSMIKKGTVVSRFSCVRWTYLRRVNFSA